MKYFSNYLTRLKLSPVSIKLRNFFLIKPVPFINPNIDKTSISDFFYYDCSKRSDTKFTVTNFGSQLFPEKKIIDEFKLKVFDIQGSMIFQKEYTLNKKESFEIIFSELPLTEKVGSFFIFHKLSYYGLLIDNKSYLSERGYVAYKRDNEIWCYMHGNNTACYLTEKNEINSLLGQSIFKSSYVPQVSFRDVSDFQVVLNNPTKDNISFEVECFDSKNKVIHRGLKMTKAFGTSVFKIRVAHVEYIKVKSTIIFCRPVIVKNYSETSFDIFHA